LRQLARKKIFARFMGWPRYCGGSAIQAVFQGPHRASKILSVRFSIGDSKIAATDVK
jgi:hypothetical protein